MKIDLFEFQNTALAQLHEKIRKSREIWEKGNPQVITFSAPTGAGKTIIMTALFEDMIFGHAEGIAEPDSVFVWLSDMPELNEQTRMKIEAMSDKFVVRNTKIIDSSFDAEYLAGGCVYFLNIQKLGRDALLTQKSDMRQYTIWETLANTAARHWETLVNTAGRPPRSFYVVIDEAHRGMSVSDRERSMAQSIMQKFIVGSEADGLPPMPLVIGVTATPQRFQRVVSNSLISTEHKVAVLPKDVRESGLLKDRIIIRYPELAINADMTMFKEAVADWRSKCALWSAYCKKEEIKDAVRPVLVIQVEDGNDRTITQTDLSVCVDTLEESLGRKFMAGEIVHTFNGCDTVNVRGLDVRYIEASRIESEEAVMVVFFKMNLSTGWDCPRAETMMSFRRAVDHTHIAQLLGRMIRTPLARRIESNAELNDVNLFLPFFDKENVEMVVKDLRESDAAIDSEIIGTRNEFVTLIKNPAFGDIFENMGGLKTYRINSARKQPALRRFIALARGLDTIDGIAPKAWKSAVEKVLQMFDSEIAQLKRSDKYHNMKKSMTNLALRTLMYDYGSNNIYEVMEPSEIISLSGYDIDNHFKRAGKLLGEGLHEAYWNRHSGRYEYDVKIEIVLLTNDNDAMERIETFAESEFNKLYDGFKTQIGKLKEGQRETYKKLAMSSATPIAFDWELPQTIDFSIGKDASVFDRHLYIPSDGGDFKVDLNRWESELIQEELEKGAVAWLRNLDRKKWALEIPYEVGGVTVSMFPDLVVVRRGASGYVFDILEPHDPSRKDNYPKAAGMAKFANDHGGQFDRIQLIRKEKGPDGREHFYRLDMGKLEIRNKVRGVTSNEELDRIFGECKVAEKGVS